MKTFNFTSVNQFVGMDYDAYLITINKSIAEEMLCASIGNRKLNSSNLNGLIRDMNENEYYYSVPSSGISFDKSGKLVNGHHTLTAFLASELDTITLTLFTGTTNLDKCDTGKSRSLVDSAIMSGNDSISVISKLALNVLRIKNNMPISNSGPKKEFSNSFVFNFAKDNEILLNEIYYSICKFKREKKKDIVNRYTKSEPSVLGAILFEMIYIEGNNKERVMEFAFGALSMDTFDNKFVDEFRKKVNQDAQKLKRQNPWTFEAFRTMFKTYYKKYIKSITKTYSKAA